MNPTQLRHLRDFIYAAIPLEEQTELDFAPRRSEERPDGQSEHLLAAPEPDD